MELILDIIKIIGFTNLFITIDKYFSPKYGKYYFVHSLCNLIIVSYTFFDIVSIYNNLHVALLISYKNPMLLTYALHFYHIIMYNNKFRFDDWLHHSLMIFIALPLGNYIGVTKLLNHSLFYTTGLPGMIDYACLCCVRNNIMIRYREKQINRYLNLYIRCPGCIIHLFITYYNIIYFNNLLEKMLSLLASIIVFWNGIYFMDQVVGNYYVERKLKNIN